MTLWFPTLREFIKAASFRWRPFAERRSKRWIANTGSFTKQDPNPVRGVAFPTTGSMLMLMRHANRQFEDLSIETVKRDSRGIPGGPFLASTKDLSFTTRLNQVTKVKDSRFGNPADVFDRDQIDNGRMPVFDQPGSVCVAGNFSTGMQCQTNADCVVGGATCDPIIPAIHHVDPTATDLDTPGGTEHLPWGQLLWDYFTVLPLSSAGPYAPPPGVSWDDFTPAAADSIPRVDLDGLRVHGRININAAPWTVLGSVPLTPMRRMPESIRDKVRDAIGLSPDEDLTAQPLSQRFAIAAVAYRDAREVTLPGGTETTGDFGDDDFGVGGWRGWQHGAPMARRGTGFLTVGELANVRHTDASDSQFRIDSGELQAPDPPNPNAPGPDYVKAVALLVALGDWVTVRSHVFTTYGTLRGEGDFEAFPDDPIERADDVDKRAVRFQETVDRLPTLVGASKPVRIGQRYVGPYIDVRND